MDISNPTHPLNPLNPLTDPMNIYGTHDPIAACVPSDANNQCILTPIEVGFLTALAVIFVIFVIWLIRKS